MEMDMFLITGLSPSSGEKQVALESDIEFTIVDDGTGIDISTLVVEISGARAIDNLEFKSGYNGTNSDISADGSNYNIIIDMESNLQKDVQASVKVQVKSLSGKYFNETYVFKTIKEGPIMVRSDPEHRGIISNHQMIILEFEDPSDDIDRDSLQVSVNGLSYITSGIFESSENGSRSNIENDDTMIIKIDPIEGFKNGSYYINWSVSDENGGQSSGRIDFDVNIREAILPATFPQTGFAGFFQGMNRVSDCGDGQSVLLEWGEAVKRVYRSDTYVLIYKNISRLDIFDSSPSYIARSDIRSVTIGGLNPGETLSWAARAMETHPDSLSFDGMLEISDGVWVFPEDTVISQSISDTDTKIYVDSISGFGSAGYLIIGTEVLRYNSLSEGDSAFLLPSYGRGLLNSSAGLYVEGDTVSFFTNCKDQNTVIIMATPTFQDGYSSGKEMNNTGLVVTDYTDNDQKFYQGYDFCGYHKAIPQKTLNGVDDCGTYLGGEYNGFRGFNLFDRMIGREEVLLDQVGEPVVLLRRIWDGEICSCMTSRRVHPKIRSCKECFGTGYVGGFSQYGNPRRSDNRIMISFSESTEDLKLGSYEHFQQEFEPSAWTTPVPAIKDRDLIVRFDFTDDQEYIYEVLKVSREKAVFRHFTRQKMDLKRLDKTDIVYTIPWTL
jgi:hypothetical protein